MKEIESYMSGFGRYQAYIYTLLFLPCFLSGAFTLVFSFSGATPNSRVIGGKDAYCQYCDLNTSANAVCTKGNSHSCSRYVYDHSQYKSTLAMEFDMVCDTMWKSAVVKSMYMVGVLIGAGLLGSLADKFGRKTVYIWSALGQLITFNILPFATNYVAFSVLSLINGGLQYGTYLTGFIIVMEMINGFARTVCGIWVQGMFAVGYIYVGVVAIFVRDWKWLQWACSIPAILYIPQFWLLPESIRWQVMNGRSVQAKETLKRASAWNRITIPDKVMDAEFDIPHERESATVLDLFRHRVLAKNTLVVFFGWFVCSMSYYGLSQNTSDLPGNDYTNYILSGAVELPGYIICIPMMEYWGRKPTLSSLFAISGVSCIASGFVPRSMSALVVILAVTGKLCVAAAFAVIYNYSAEIYPTVVRNAGTGFSSVFARVGSILAPQIHLLGPYVADWLPIVIYGSFGVAAALLTLLLPETKGRELPETIQDGIEFNSKKTKPKTLLMTAANSEPDLTTNEYQMSSL